jgi:hypothetical protein
LRAAQWGWRLVQVGMAVAYCSNWLYGVGVSGRLSDVVIWCLPCRVTKPCMLQVVICVCISLF